MKVYPSSPAIVARDDATKDVYEFEASAQTNRNRTAAYRVGN
ncbi:hypothetical protein [Rhizobium leguminosarum]|nr:hypothetical protein [Rhizobium leguminosarum]